jgi:DNA-binding NarL/FixJ family response regulator
MSMERGGLRSRLHNPRSSPALVEVDPPGYVQETDRAMRIVIGDGDVLMRTGLASLLERTGQSVVGVAGDTAGLLELVREHHPDLVIVDGMPPTHTVEGLKAAEQIRLERPDIGIMVLSSHMKVEHAGALLASGHGIGYLLKNRVADVEEFFDGLRRVARGGCVLDPALLQELTAARHRYDPFALLSKREFDVLALMAEGRSNLGIARALLVAEGTVEKHVRNILTKLNLCGSPYDHRRVLAVIEFLRAKAAARGEDAEPWASLGAADAGAECRDQRIG